MTHVHFIGIGGTGLSAIAQVLLESGYTVSGSDRALSPLAQRVRDAGGQVFVGHRAENVSGADLVVRSSAIPDDNVEVQAARVAGTAVLKRAEFLGELTQGRTVIAVAGTHGKTTTTAMIAWMLAALGCDPTYIIGGVAANLGSNAHAGKGQYFVIEADEYDRMFLGLTPQIAIVTNVEHDHPDCFPTPEDFYRAFGEFVARLTPDGVLLACSDDPGAARLLEESLAKGRRAFSYGLQCWLDRPHHPAYCGVNLQANEHGGFTFEWRMADSAWQMAIGHQPSAICHLRVPGHHNVRNALAALSVAQRLGLSVEESAKALGEYLGTGRRFEVRGEAGGVTVIDDYAHHPTEIRATLNAARARYPGRAIWAVWQPHTYSRTRTLFDQFAAAFEDADHVIVPEIYAARESTPKDGFSARQVVAAMQHPDVRFIPDLGGVVDVLLAHLRRGDVLLTLSAGDADQVSAQVWVELARRSA